MPRLCTLQDIDSAGFDVRLWCFTCARGSTIDAIIWMRFAERGLALDLGAVQPFFPCRSCGGREALIVPCTRPSRAGEPCAELVAGWFHAMRSANKKRRR
jgi:hypothetical protein